VASTTGAGAGAGGFVPTQAFVVVTSGSRTTRELRAHPTAATTTTATTSVLIRDAP